MNHIYSKNIYSAKLDRKPYPSVFFINETSIFRSNDPAVFNEEFARWLIEMFTEPGELVWDPMCGIGTIPRCAHQLKRRGIGSDINAEAVRLAHELDPDHYNCYREADALNIDYIENDTVDLTLISPPFGLIVDAKHLKYGDDSRDIANNSKSYEQWNEKFRPCVKQMFLKTKPGRLCLIETRPRRLNWDSKPLWEWIYHNALEAGFEWFDMIVEIQQPYGKFPQDMEMIEHRKPYPAHSFLLMFQKPEQERFPRQDGKKEMVTK